MMFISVAFEALVSPNDLMLNAPSSSELERRSRARSRPATHTERIMRQTGYTVTKQNKTQITVFLKCKNQTSVLNKVLLIGQCIMSKDSERLGAGVRDQRNSWSPATRELCRLSSKSAAFRVVQLFFFSFFLIKLLKWFAIKKKNTFVENIFCGVETSLKKLKLLPRQHVII